MEKIAIFGVGITFHEYYFMLADMYEVCVIVDNDQNKWGKNFYGIECMNPIILYEYDVDKIIITSLKPTIIEEIKSQIKSMGLTCEDVILMNDIFSYLHYDKINESFTYEDNLGNKVIIEDDCYVNGLSISFLGSDNTLRIEKDVRISGVINCEFRGKKCNLNIGKGTTFGNALIQVSEGGSVCIGEDCMFADSVSIMQMAYHPIYDLSTGRRINTPKNIKIGNHVWIGRNVALLAGFHIGDGSIVGYGSISSSCFENNCIIAGNPSRVIRTGVTWGRPAVGYGEFDTI